MIQPKCWLQVCNIEQRNLQVDTQHLKYYTEMFLVHEMLKYTNNVVLIAWIIFLIQLHIQRKPYFKTNSSDTWLLTKPNILWDVKNYHI
jgi:hypothetical protein